MTLPRGACRFIVWFGNEAMVLIGGLVVETKLCCSDTLVDQAATLPQRSSALLCYAVPSSCVVGSSASRQTPTSHLLQKAADMGTVATSLVDRGEGVRARSGCFALPCHWSTSFGSCCDLHPPVLPSLFCILDPATLAHPSSPFPHPRYPQSLAQVAFLPPSLRPPSGNPPANSSQAIPS